MNNRQVRIICSPYPHILPRGPLFRIIFTPYTVFHSTALVAGTVRNSPYIVYSEDIAKTAQVKFGPQNITKSNNQILVWSTEYLTGGSIEQHYSITYLHQPFLIFLLSRNQKKGLETTVNPLYDDLTHKILRKWYASSQSTERKSRSKCRNPSLHRNSNRGGTLVNENQTATIAECSFRTRSSCFP